MMPASFISIVNPVNRAMAPPWEKPAKINRSEGMPDRISSRINPVT